MKFYQLFIFNFINATNEKLIPEVELQEYEDTPKKSKEIKLTYKTLNNMFFVFGFILIGLYFFNEFLIDTLDIIDAIFFSIVLFLNLVINWMTKPKFSNEKIYSKKRIVCLFINITYIIGLLILYTLGYVLDIIQDCNLFTGAKNCHSEFTLFQYVCSFLMFLILLLKILF